MLSLVQGVDLAEIITNWGGVVGNDVNHDVHSLSVGSVDEVLEVLLGSKVGVDLLPVSGPVAVVSSIKVVNDGGDPNGVEAHALNVVKVVLDSLPGASAIVAEVATTLGASVRSGESVGEDLVDRSLLPVGGAGGRSISGCCRNKS